MKVSELAGANLDFWVAVAEGARHRQGRAFFLEGGYVCTKTTQRSYAPSMYWAQGGPIIDKEKLGITPAYDMKGEFVSWACQPKGMGHLAMEDESVLVAAMRAYVASKFGDEVDAPQTYQQEK